MIESTHAPMMNYRPRQQYINIIRYHNNIAFYLLFGWNNEKLKQITYTMMSTILIEKEIW